MDFLDLFYKKKLTVQNPSKGKKIGASNFPDFEPQIAQQHFFIICPGGQTPNQLFFTNIYQNEPTGNLSTVGSLIKNKTFCNGPKWQYFGNKLSKHFFKIRLDKGELLFRFVLLFFIKEKFHRPNISVYLGSKFRFEIYKLINVFVVQTTYYSKSYTGLVGNSSL